MDQEVSYSDSVYFHGAKGMEKKRKKFRSHRHRYIAIYKRNLIRPQD